MRNVAAAVSAMIILLGACASEPETSPEASSAPSTASADAQPSSEPEVTASASAAATGSAPPVEPEGTWELTGEWEGTCRGGCGEGVAATVFAQSVVAWRDGFAALGREYDGPAMDGQVDDRPRIWLSVADHWQEVAGVSFGVPHVSLIGLAPMPDGTLLAVGTVSERTEVGELTHLRAATWVSADGASWAERPLPVPPGLRVSSLTYGPRGYAFTAGGGIWFSANTETWVPAYDAGPDVLFSRVAAGADGFVATGMRTILAADGAQTFEPIVVASGDGRAWQPAAGAPALSEPTSLGGDWLAIGLEPATIRVWASTDGLTWTRALDVNDLTGPDGPKAGEGLASEITGATLTSDGDRAFLTLTFNHCCVTMAGGVGVWSTTDGAEWTEVPIEDGAVLQSAAADRTGTVLAGYLGRAGSAALWRERP